MLRQIGCMSAYYAGHPDKQKSTTHYVFTFTGGAMSWISKMQRCTALSTTKVQYFATTKACKEALWLSRLVSNLDCTNNSPLLHCDNQSVIQLAWDLVFHAKTKHIQLVKVNTQDNPIDLLIKSLPCEHFAYCWSLMGIL